MIVKAIETKRAVLKELNVVRSALAQLDARGDWGCRFGRNGFYLGDGTWFSSTRWGENIEQIDRAGGLARKDRGGDGPLIVRVIGNPSLHLRLGLAFDQTY